MLRSRFTPWLPALLCMLFIFASATIAFGCSLPLSDQEKETVAPSAPPGKDIQKEIPMKSDQPPPAPENAEPPSSVDETDADPNTGREPADPPYLAPPRIVVQGLFPESLAGEAASREVTSGSEVIVAGTPNIAVVFRFSDRVEIAAFRSRFSLDAAVSYTLTQNGNAVVVGIDTRPLRVGVPDGTISTPLRLQVGAGLKAASGAVLTRPVTLTLNIKEPPRHTAWLEGREGFIALPRGTHAVDPEGIIAHISFSKAMRRDSVEYFVRKNLTSITWPDRETIVTFLWIDDRHLLVRLTGIWPGRRYSITPTGALDADGLPIQSSNALRLLAAKAAGELWQMTVQGAMERVMLLDTWPERPEIGTMDRFLFWEYQEGDGENWPGRPVLVDIVTSERSYPVTFDYYNSFQWAPDGAEIILGTRDSILAVSITDGVSRVLLSRDFETDKRAILGARVSPDGKRLAYVLRSNRIREAPTLMIHNLATGLESVYEGLMRPTTPHSSAGDFTWTPNGDGIIFTDYDESGLLGKVVRLDLSRGTHQMLAGNAVQPKLSPDGELLYVRTIVSDVDGQFIDAISYIFTPKGRIMLPKDNRYEAVAWSPDSTQLLLRVDRSDPEGRGTEQSIGIWDGKTGTVRIVPASGEPVGWNANGNLFFLTFGKGTSAPPWVRQYNVITTEKLFVEPATAKEGDEVRISIPEEVSATLLQEAELTLVSDQGSILSVKPAPPPGGEVAFSLAGLPAGAYHLVLRHRRPYGAEGLDMATFWVEPTQTSSQ